MDNAQVPKWLNELPLAPVFRPTDTEFADPIAFISKIEKEASAFGICKVIPPLPKPSKRYVLNNLNNSLSQSNQLVQTVFTTRQQELGQAPNKTRQVWQSGEVYTLEQFELKSKAFSRRVLGKIKGVTPQVIESLFWKANEDNKPIYVEYANDVPGSGFGKPEGFLRHFHARKRQMRRRTRRGMFSYCAPGNVRSSSSRVEPQVSVMSSPSTQPTGTENKVLHSDPEPEGTAGWKLTNSPWNLQAIARSAGSLTRFMLDDIPGVTSPMVYIGMLFSWFAWHVEDHELHSLNFLHMGSQKTWYAVPGDYGFAFEEVIRKHAYGGDIDNLASLKLLGEKTTLLSPELVIASGIPCCRLVQNPGEFVVTFPRAYHVGFSHGFNCGEAANFGTPQWLTVAKDAAVRRAAMDHLPMLSHQQLLYLLTTSFFLRVPKSLLSGVHSSRLRDRLKKDRELLVKKAFIKDVLKENNLLVTLLGKDSAFRAVLWHPDLLPSFTNELSSQTGIVVDPIVDKNDELSEIPDEDADQDGAIHQPTSYMDSVDDMYLDSDDDISCEFQVDSGTMPCIACGILGYPFMVVVQPSKKASLELFQAEYLTKTMKAELVQKPESYSTQYTSNNYTSATISDEGWESSRFLRPRIFCLEHAVQIKELLRLKGGAKMLVICHSDFRKIKTNAPAIAEEVETAFNYNEVALDSASEEELSLIDHAIDCEKPTHCDEDWTSKLGMNLRFSIKARTNCSYKKTQLKLNLEYLLSVIAPGSVISTINWCSRKSRTKRDSICGTNRKTQVGNPFKMNENIHESGYNMKVKEKALLQYSRKKFRNKSRSCTGLEHVSECGMQCSPEVTDANCVKINANGEDTSGDICVKNMEAYLEELGTAGSTEICLGSHDEVEMVEGNMKHSSDASADLVDSKPFDTGVQLNFPLETYLSTSDDSICQDKLKDNRKADNASEDLDTVKCYGSPAKRMLVVEKTNIIGNNNLHENVLAAESRAQMAISSFEETGSKPEGGNPGSCASDHSCDTNAMFLDKACILLENYDPTASGISDLQDLNEADKHYCISTGSKLTTDLEVDIELPTSRKQKFKESCQVGVQAFPSLLKEQDKGKIIADADMTSKNRNKRTREVALQTEPQNDFVRSPCEGLRPRKRKEDPTDKSKYNVWGVTEQQIYHAKKIKLSSGSSFVPCCELMHDNKIYKCHIEGCRMCFKTRAELLLHKRHKCHYKECRKRFRSHKYVALHQRVHDDQRPLKCPWKGCTMTFKWAWARTEHLRLHTGERPYQCKIEGCGRTFRFVSDFSRHRRKTGHYVNSTI